MNSLTRFTTVGIPILIGAGVAWFSIRIIKSEQRLADRKVELELQLKGKNLRNK